MNWIVRAVMALSTLMGSQVVHAADPPQVRWLSDVAEAWQMSQSHGRPLLVFVTQTGCLPCAKMKVNTFADPKVAARISQQFVALVIHADQPSALLKDLAVKAYPTTFVISPEAVILERIDGFMPPEKLAAKLAQADVASRQRALVQPVSAPGY